MPPSRSPSGSADVTLPADTSYGVSETGRRWEGFWREDRLRQVRSDVFECGRIQRALMRDRRILLVGEAVRVAAAATAAHPGGSRRLSDVCVESTRSW